MKFHEKLITAKVRYSKSPFYLPIFGALIGAAFACIILLCIAGFKDAMEGRNEGNSPLFILLMIIGIILAAFTLAPLWAEHVHFYYISMPWYSFLSKIFPEEIAIAIGFIVNGAILGAVIGTILFYRRSKQAA